MGCDASHALTRGGEEVHETTMFPLLTDVSSASILVLGWAVEEASKQIWPIRGAAAPAAPLVPPLAATLRTITILFTISSNKMGLLRPGFR
jgi:hypothetical protein